VHAGLRALRADATTVRAILLTHWHNDHSAGAQAIHASTGAPVYYIEMTSGSSQARPERRG
jgi:glyoxylase-like metal-dependent hydrolase (beta-lactamase superfamily II)